MARCSRGRSHAAAKPAPWRRCFPREPTIDVPLGDEKDRSAPAMANSKRWVIARSSRRNGEVALRTDCRPAIRVAWAFRRHAERGPDNTLTDRFDPYIVNPMVKHSTKLDEVDRKS